MHLYPAIDIRGGRAVRLHRGRFDQETVYDADPVAAARRLVEAGADRLHVVDLDGAREGQPVALDQIGRIAQLGVPVQAGGGLRTLDAISAVLESGASRVVLGTAAHRDPTLLQAALERHGDGLAVAVDVRDGKLTTAGWTETGEVEAGSYVDHLLARGVRTVVYTDADRDGTLEGPDLEAARRLAGAVAAVDGARFVYSGGVGALADLEALAGLGASGLEGVIVGKALYEGRFTVPEARAALGEAA